jgi:hypothetical protein
MCRNKFTRRSKTTEETNRGNVCMLDTEFSISKVDNKRPQEMMKGQ